MDFSVIFQLRTKKFWWMDVIFYFVISLLVATILCWLIFLAKDNFLRDDIRKETAALQTVGTADQKAQEQTVIKYQKEIGDFSGLFKNHEFASNVFAFMQTQTMPNIWFKQFALDEKGGSVQLSGESDTMDVFSRQVDTFEGNKYVGDVSTLNSSLGSSARVGFNINLLLQQKIFSYISDMAAVLQPETSSAQLLVEQPGASPASSSAGFTPAKNSAKLIITFDLGLVPQVVGAVDQIRHEITLNVPYGTNVKNLTPSIDISPDATILPVSDAPGDFTNPVIYTVTAQDGSLQTYTARVIVAGPPQASKKSGMSLSSVLIIVVIILIIIVAVAAVFIRKKINPVKLVQGLFSQGTVPENK